MIIISNMTNGLFSVRLKKIERNTVLIRICDR